MAKRSDPMADALGHHFGEPGGKALGNFRSPEPADIPDETEAPAATPLPALRPLSDQGDTDYGDATYQARANTRAGMRALQVRQLLAVHEGMRTRARENGIAVQEFLSRLVLGELARPLPQRARRRRLPQHSGRMGTRVAQVYLRDDIHKAFQNCGPPSMRCHSKPCSPA